MLNSIVWFWKNGEGRGISPEPAIVTRVLDETTVDLWVFCGHGAQREERNVQVVGYDLDGLPYDVPNPPRVRYVTLKAFKDEPQPAEEASDV
jgi:hypothetical protein